MLGVRKKEEERGSRIQGREGMEETRLEIRFVAHLPIPFLTNPQSIALAPRTLLSIYLTKNPNRPQPQSPSPPPQTSSSKRPPALPLAPALVRPSPLALPFHFSVLALPPLVVPAAGLVPVLALLLAPALVSCLPRSRPRTRQQLVRHPQHQPRSWPRPRGARMRISTACCGPRRRLIARRHRHWHRSRYRCGGVRVGVGGVARGRGGRRVRCSWSMDWWRLRRRCWWNPTTTTMTVATAMTR